MTTSDEDGSVTPLIVGLLALVIAIVWIGFGATLLYVQHRDVVTLADSLADHVASHYDVPGYYEEGADTLAIDSTAATGETEKVLAALPPGMARRDVRLVEVSVEGSRISVHLAADGRILILPPFLGGVSATVPLEATGTSELATRR